MSDENVLTNQNPKWCEVWLMFDIKEEVDTTIIDNSSKIKNAIKLNYLNPGQDSSNEIKKHLFTVL